MMLTKEQLIQHLSDKMTNQDIANIYNVSFQKIQQLIKKYRLNQKELRKVNKYIVYEHWLKGEIVYIGSGVWYRCRRYKNRRNSEHVHLMVSGKLEYRIVGEYEKVEDARKLEAVLIQKYKQLGQAKFNKKMH
ncbi:helix-turn-helix domain-containing protein [Peribacillus sp. NPDC006672]|uniref:helix-turn-helix domain-containing protein n=1 Tax=Peribacillus sp. NPDC006672 TaxID=3390606 RepID=UPI003D01070A